MNFGSSVGGNVKSVAFWICSLLCKRLTFKKKKACLMKKSNGSFSIEEFNSTAVSFFPFH